jgi:hypothetical protein
LEVLTAPCDWWISEIEWYEPDVIVFRREDFDPGGPLRATPLLVVEVASPSTRFHDLNAKFAESFGREGADTIRQECPVELAYGGQKDIEYLRSLEAISGETTVDSWSESYGQDGAGSRTKSERVKARYSVEELRALPPHNAWLVDRHRALRPVATHTTTPCWAHKDGIRVARSVAWAEAHGFTRPSDIPSMGKYQKALATWRETYAAMPWRICSADSGPLVSAHAIQGEETHDEW